ncbi:tetratricopeptide repeat protein [Tenacibaculum agarivorans]|uniref:tetratricopeptide repeat protein n=1 Tax=Tenacibaculum agarivorans TaxID=1908389 RepID=UPI00094BBCA0|nr:hypothetical protein [Tenacibaculum agarivorans]
MRNVDFVKCLLLCLLCSTTYKTNAQTKVDSLQVVLDKTAEKSKRLQVLDLLTREMIRKNHQDLIPSLKKYMSLAKELKEYDFMASKSRFLIQQHIIKGEHTKGLQLCDSMLSFKSNFNKESSEAHILLKKGGIYFSELAYKKAIENYLKSAELFEKSGDIIFAADAYFFTGQSYSNTGDFIKAIKHYELANNLYEKAKDYEYMFLVSKELDLIYKRNGLKSLANENIKKLIRKSKKYKLYDNLRYFYLSLTLEATQDNKFHLAEKFLDSSQYYKRAIKDISLNLYNEIRAKKVALFLKIKQGNVIAADSIYKSFLQLEKQISHKKMVYAANLYKGHYLVEKGESEKALALLLETKEFVEKKSSRNNDLQEVERLLAMVYEQLGRYKEALIHKNNYINLKDSVHKSSLTNALAFHQTRFETTQKEKEILQQESEIQELELEKKIAKSKRNMLIAILFSLVLIGSWIWWRGKQKRKQLQEKILRNKKELTNFTNQLLQKSKEQELLQFQLEELKEKVTEKEEVTTIQDLVATKILTKEDWYTFKEKFTNVYPNFFLDIKNKGYKLTKAEERLVSLEKLGLDNSEIANMLGVSVDTIFMSRYRLRRKIQAPTDISLIEYFS